MSKTWLIAALALTLSPLTTPAQEYIIKIKRSGVGDETQVKQTATTEILLKILDNAGDVEFTKELNTIQKLIFREIGLKKAQASEELVRVTRNYEHAECIGDGTSETLPYQGKTLLIKKATGEFHFKIKGGEAIKYEESDDLLDEFSYGGHFRKLFGTHFLPCKAVTLNETWTIDLKRLAKELSKAVNLREDGWFKMDATKSKGSGKLVKAYQKNGKQFGVIELTLEFTISHWMVADATCPTKDSKISIKLAWDGCIDGSLEASHEKWDIDCEFRAEQHFDSMDAIFVGTVRSSWVEARVPLAK